MTDRVKQDEPAGSGRRRRSRAELPVRNTRALDITEVLRKKILGGQMAPGTHLYEEALASQI